MMQSSENPRCRGPTTWRKADLRCGNMSRLREKSELVFFFFFFFFSRGRWTVQKAVGRKLLQICVCFETHEIRHRSKQLSPYLKNSSHLLKPKRKRLPWLKTTPNAPRFPKRHRCKHLGHLAAHRRRPTPPEGPEQRDALGLPRPVELHRRSFGGFGKNLRGAGMGGECFFLL